jgi:predicted NAD/FAD-binding protein
MNMLQGLDAATPFCVTLNDRGAIDPDRVIQRMEYAHPLFTERAVAAQRRHREIDGARLTYYCGAYWRYGFHEDGVVSALDALQHFRDDRSGSESEWHEQRYLLRAG